MLVAAAVSEERLEGDELAVQVGAAHGASVSFADLLVALVIGAILAGAGTVLS